MLEEQPAYVRVYVQDVRGIYWAGNVASEEVICIGEHKLTVRRLIEVLDKATK